MKFLIFILLMMNLQFSLFASDNIETLKENYKYSFVNMGEIPEGVPVVGVGDRIKADALLEVAGEGYFMYRDFKTSVRKDLPQTDEVILIMPKIDLLDKYLGAISKTTKQVLVFIMEKDKLKEPYGDRSYETYIRKEIDRRLPKNVKVFKLKDESVTDKGSKNNFEISNLENSLVFQNQIKPIYLRESKVKYFK